MRGKGPVPKPAPGSPASGEQHEVRCGDQLAVACEVGAALRLYSVGDVDVLDGFPAEEVSSAGRGQVLAPWPNRLDGGTYAFEGREGHAALDEPEHGNAIHGLVRWLPWRVVSKAEGAVELGCVLHPQPGYPWRLDLRVEYRLEEDGLTTTARATNLSDRPAPFGLGFHPYLSLGTVIDEAVLHVPAHHRLVADQRGLPTGPAMPVEGTSFDFSAPRRIGETRLDTAYTAITRDRDQRARVVLTSADGTREVTLWTDPGFPHLMVYTGDTLELAERRRQGIAIEPMTCPPNAFRSGRDVIRLDAGASWSGQWGIVPRIEP
jgi:galactose mutarotase-like enzyme